MKAIAPEWALNDPLGLAVVTATSADKRYNRNFINYIIEKSTEKINTLEPSTKEKAIKMFRTAYSQGILAYIYSGYRDFDLQQELYDKFINGTGNVASPAGLSYHNYGMAFDVLVPTTDGANVLKIGYNALNLINIKLGLGLVWGGTFKSVDMPHFQNEVAGIRELQNNSAEYKAWFEAQGKPTQDELIQYNDIIARFDKVKKDMSKSWFRRNLAWIAPIATLGLISAVLAIVKFRSE